MSKMITGAEYPLGKVFSDDFEYHIPQYQRPYAWTTEETGVLFSDLRDFFMEEDEENYFLGSTVLIKQDGERRAEVIDGQQRLTTLTILLATIASKLSGVQRDNCVIRIKSQGDIFMHIEEQPRLFLRQRDQPFFSKYIQGIDIDGLLALDPTQMEDEAQRNIQENCRTLNKAIDEEFGDDLQKLVDFTSFLLTRCYMVAVSTPSQSSAYRVFAVMNSRGLDLLPMDIIKANVIAEIPETTRADYADKWEELEVQASRSGFDDVFSCIRMVYAKKKAKKSLNEEFTEFVVKHDGMTPEALIDDLLEPYTEAYLDVKGCAYSATTGSEVVNDRLGWLNRIDNSDWVPVALKFLATRRGNSDYVQWFFIALERLASFMHVTSKDINQRINRYVQILDEMDERPEHGQDNSPRLETVLLTEEERDQFIAALKGDIYLKTPRKRNYVILRLDSFVADGAATYDSRILTIEHVLPQTVRDGSEWATVWPDVAQRENWLNKIANLVPLTRYKNSEAQNFDFTKKKAKYFTGRKGTSSYALTTQVLNESEWTPEVVEQRQKNLMEVFKKGWGL